MSFKMSTMAIMEDLKMSTIHHMVIKESIQFVHKVIFNQSPKVIYDLFTYSNCNNKNIRGVRKHLMKKSHKSQKVTNSLFFRSLFLFNKLDNEVRTYNPKKISKYLQDNIKYIFPFNKIPKNE